jgi:transposase
MLTHFGEECGVTPKNWTADDGRIGPGKGSYRRIAQWPDIGVSVRSSSQISREFLEGRAGMHELARRYSLSRNLIRLSVRKYEAGEFSDELAAAVRIAEYERKIAELERKVGQLTMEVDLLKKGAQLGRPGSDVNYSIVSGPTLSQSRKDAES